MSKENPEAGDVWVYGTSIVLLFDEDGLHNLVLSYPGGPSPFIGAVSGEVLSDGLRNGQQYLGSISTFSQLLKEKFNVN